MSPSVNRLYVCKGTGNTVILIIIQLLTSNAFSLCIDIGSKYQKYVAKKIRVRHRLDLVYTKII